jgi:radical SAM superfamily enzyme YgiQ (UPF0313 family)
MDNYFREIGNFKPELVGFTCYTPYVATFHKNTQRLRKYIPDAAMVAGGAHPTVWPEWTLEKMPQFDYAMQGECDRSIVSLAKMISGKCSETEVPGLVYRTDGKIVKNERDYIDDLNDLPQTDRSYLDRYYSRGMYWNMAARGKMDMMITSRGCPYSCNFCFKVEKKYRFRSTGHLIEEFEDFKRRGITAIHIQDDAFTANKKRCLEIAE